MGNAVTQCNESSRHTSRRPRKTVIDAQLQSSHVEIVKVTVERGEAVAFLKMAVFMLPEPLPEEIADMSEDDQYQVADVGRDQVIIRRIFNDGFGKVSASVAASIPVALVPQWAELSMLSRYPTRFGWRRWLEKSRGWLVLICSVCLCGREKDGGKRQGWGADVGERIELG